MKITRLTSDMIGCKISCMIEDTIIPLAKIQYEKGSYFICQNYKKGVICNNKLGFKYSWTVEGGKPGDIENENVNNIKRIITEWDEKNN